MKKTNQKGRFNVGKPRTINSLREHFNLWVKETNSDRNQLKNYFNVEYPLIYSGTGMDDKMFTSYFPHHIFILEYLDQDIMQ